MFNTLYVSADIGNFTTEPDVYEIERQKQYTQPMPEAYHRDINGNLVSTEMVDDQDIIRGTNTGISPMGYWQNGYYYVFARYEPNTYKTDNYRFFVSQVNWWNKTRETVILKYTQKETVITEWDVSGKIELDAKFKVKFLATLQGRFGAQVTQRHVTERSDIVEAQMNVPPGYEAYINKYKGGAYAGGSAVWYKYYVTPNNDYILVGTYTETNQGGWGIMSNVTSYINGSRYKGIE
jgi:hypothetical protein